MILVKMMISNMNLLFQEGIFRCHVSFRECRSLCVFFELTPTKKIGPSF